MRVSPWHFEVPSSRLQLPHTTCLQGFAKRGMSNFGGTSTPCSRGSLKAWTSSYHVATLEKLPFICRVFPTEERSWRATNCQAKHHETVALPNIYELWTPQLKPSCAWQKHGETVKNQGFHGLSGICMDVRYAWSSSTFFKWRLLTKSRILMSKYISFDAIWCPPTPESHQPNIGTKPGFSIL